MVIEDINSFISRKAKEHGVDEDLVYSVIKHESGGNPKAMSGAGAKGLMQLMPETAKGLGVKNIDDPYDNVEGGIKYLSQLQGKYKSPELTIAAYNAGPGNVDKHKGIPPFRETQNYVRNVNKTYLMAKAKKGDQGHTFSPYDPFALPAYGNDTEPTLPTPKKEIKTIQKRKGIEKFVKEELAPENNFKLEPVWSRRQKAENAINEEYGDVYKTLSPEGQQRFNRTIKDPFVKEAVNVTPLTEDITRGARVFTQSGVRAIPQIAEDLQNTARYLTGGEKISLPTSDYARNVLSIDTPLNIARLLSPGGKSPIPKADYVKHILPDLATQEERNKRIPEQITGGIAPYAYGGAALKTISQFPKVASLISKMPQGARTAGALALPITPVKGIVKNVAQGVTGGAQASISQAVKENQDPSLQDIGKAAGQSGVLTAATILGGKALGKGVSALTNKIVETKLKPKLDIEPKSSIAEEALNKFRQPQATETVTGKVIEPEIPTKPIQSIDAYKLDPETIAKEEANVQIKKMDEPLAQKPAISESEYFGARKVPEEGTIGDLGYSPAPQALKSRIEAEVAPSKENIYGAGKPQVKIEDISDINKSVDIETPIGKVPVSQAKINTIADQLLNSESSRGKTYKEILTDDQNYSPEFQKQMHDELLTKAKGQAGQIRGTQRKEYNYDSQPTINKRYIDEGLNEIDQLEYKQRALTSKGEEPSHILNDKINVIKQQLKDTNTTGKTGLPIKDIWMTKRYGGTQKTPYKSNIPEQFQQKESNLINSKNLAKKVGIKNLIKSESGTAELEYTGVPIFKNQLKKIDDILVGSKRIFHEPFRQLKRNGEGALADSIRDLQAYTGSYIMEVEKKMLMALADIPVQKTSYPIIKDALNSIKADDLISGTVLNSPIWSKMTPEEKAWTHIVARFFRESADYLGLDKGDYISNYFPRMIEYDPILGEILNKKSTTSPSIVHGRKAENEVFEFTDNIPAVVMRYANGVRRQMLSAIVGEGKVIMPKRMAERLGLPADTATSIGEDKYVDSLVRSAWNKAQAEGNQEVLNAITQIRENLLNVTNTNLTDDYINKGIRNFVENSIKQNVSSGLLNLTQTPTLLMSEVGVPRYLETTFTLLGGSEDDKIILDAIKHNVDIGQHVGAKFDLQRAISEGLISPETSFKQYKEATQEKILIDAFGSIEKYLNQPLALISGMIKAAGGKKQLADALRQINNNLASDSPSIRQAAMNARARLIGEGLSLNEKVNFVRIQANRPNYESSQIKALLPMLNYPIKEAGWAADKWYEVIMNPEGSEGRMQALSALTTYLFMKSLVLGPKAGAELWIPAFIRSGIRDRDPETYKAFEDKLQDIDDKLNIVGYAGLDLSHSGGYIDPSDYKNINSPVLQAAKNAWNAPGVLFSDDSTLSQKIKAGGDIAKIFVKAPSINAGKYEIPTATGQITEGIAAGVNAARGERKVGRNRYKTDLQEELKSLLAPLKETQAAYREKTNRANASEILRKGHLPSRTEIREISRAKYGDERAGGEDEQITVLDSLRTGTLRTVNTLFDEAMRTGKTEKVNQYALELYNLGLDKEEVDAHVERVKEAAQNSFDPDTIEKRKERVRALTR